MRKGDSDKEIKIRMHVVSAKTFCLHLPTPLEEELYVTVGHDLGRGALGTPKPVS